MATTQTIFKGHITNPDLPILTPDGPQNFYFVDFCAKLALHGYEMTPTQKAATLAFVNSLVNSGLTKYISCVYPFIGSAQKISAAGVPLFGGSDLALTDAYGGMSISGDEILGIRITPVREIKFGELSPEQNFIGVAASVNKISTSGVSEYSDHIFPFGISTFNFRLQKTSSGEYFRIYYPQEISTNLTMIGTIDNISDAGSFYALGMFKNPSGYTRLVRSGDVVVGVSSEIVEYHKPLLQTLDMNSYMGSNPSPNYISEFTSFTFFKELMNRQQAETFISILKTYMTALGREVE